LIQIYSYLDIECSDKFGLDFVKKQRLYEVKTEAKGEMNGFVLMLSFTPHNFLNFYFFALEPVSKYAICKFIIFGKISDWLISFGIKA
jgi:hypothetical protein